MENFKIGYVSKFFPERGYGFITEYNKIKDYKSLYFRVESLKCEINEGMIVKYKWSVKYDKLRAIEIDKIRNCDLKKIDKEIFNDCLFSLKDNHKSFALQDYLVTHFCSNLTISGGCPCTVKGKMQKIKDFLKNDFNNFDVDKAISLYDITIGESSQNRVGKDDYASVWVSIINSGQDVYMSELLPYKCFFARDESAYVYHERLLTLLKKDFSKEIEDSYINGKSFITKQKDFAKKNYCKKNHKCSLLKEFYRLQHTIYNIE